MEPDKNHTKKGRKRKASSDTKTKRKRGRPPRSKEGEKPKTYQEPANNEPYVPTVPPMDPETSLSGHLSSTVHWDPNGIEGRKIGYKVKVETAPNKWMEGRITRYDPDTHKHCLTFKDQHAWIWLRNRQHNILLATRIVWAHVKGYAWWPGLVMESNEPERAGYVRVEFFGTGDVSTLKESPETIRNFRPDEIDPIVAKHKKKRNQQAIQLARQEWVEIQRLRNEAAVWYATKAIHLAGSFVGRRVKIFRADVNYPSGDTVVGKVKTYSTGQKKWLLAYESSKYSASWVNLNAKEVSTVVLDTEEPDPSPEDLLPYIYGFQSLSESLSELQTAVARLLDGACHACAQSWQENDRKLTCTVCHSAYHNHCVDPPVTAESWQRREDFVCSRCVPCAGCYGKDICFGAQIHAIPKSLDLPANAAFLLCGMCKDAYDEDRYCPNCRHSWDDDKRVRVTQQLEQIQTKRGRKGFLEDSDVPIDFGTFTGDDEWPEEAQIDPTFFYPETSEWGFTEGTMLVCDSCNVWIHAGCAGVGKEGYDTITAGNHPVYSQEFLCKVCCKDRCRDIISALQQQDRTGIFAVPVTEKVAPNYHDIIKVPMDLFTMSQIAESREHSDYVWVREKFELMVLNALVFNKNYSAVWHEAKRFFHQCTRTIFETKGKAAPPSQYFDAIEKCFSKFEEEKKKEKERIQVDDEVEKKDLVAGTIATTVTLPPLRETPPDLNSCVPFTDVSLTPTDAFYCSWMECCFTCGSSGASDTMIICVDCGEAYHSFCANVPIRSMNAFSEAGWRCANCKICEISGDVPNDETKMLFCEMCDRAFNIDLLDPPLQAAPPGLWICEQCVECNDCNGKLDPNGASLTHWSSHADRCYRCGGCDGPIDENYPMRKCKVCAKFLRQNDSDILLCKNCKEFIHDGCDPQGEAARKMQFDMTKEHSLRALKPKIETFECSSCCPPPSSTGDLDKSGLYSFCWERICSGLFPTTDNPSNCELFARLTSQMEWEIRSTSSQEYLSVVEQAMNIYKLATSQHQDPRLVVQTFLAKSTSIPYWTCQRALRFIWVARRAKWDSPETPVDPANTVSLVASAKLAASFIRVVSPTVGIDMVQLPCSSRIEILLQPPNECGTFEYHQDDLRTEVDGVIDRASRLKNAELPIEQECLNESNEDPVLSTVLCGWNDLSHLTRHFEWKDPRKCCFCHLCGDDDAGFHDSDEIEQVGEFPLPSLGRLLPMSSGLWAHTLCALWSSEVWETPNDGFVHAVEKARARGSQLKCFGCGRPGATVGCNKSNCSFNYHFPCAKACGAVFTADQHVYCKNHASSASGGILSKVGFEFMKALVVAPEDKKAMTDMHDMSHSVLCPRIGALVVHSLGDIEQRVDGFHTKDYLHPPGYTATRIFFSARTPRLRTVYIMKIGRSADNQPEFRISAADDPDNDIVGDAVATVYRVLLERLRRTDRQLFRNDTDMFSRLPSARRSRRKAYGLNGAQFFGFGLASIRRLLETRPGIEAAAAQLNKSSPMYRFCFTQPSVDSILDLQRKRAASKAEQALENSTGCARTEGTLAFARSGGSGRITRALVRSAEDTVDTSSAAAKTNTSPEKDQADRSLNQAKYRRMKSVPIEQRLATHRSHIHGWGLFTKLEVKKDDPIIEYMGEVIRQSTADQREKQYEISGEGSCYMFRLDLNRIVDATKIGCMARFMNHCCQPNAYAKIITVDSETDRGDRKIVIFANRAINAGEEITYDYKFPVEDGSIRCTCGAPNCIGRLN